MTAHRPRQARRTAGFDPRLPRALHPGAWWVWAVGLATAASRTTNPLLLGLIVGVLVVVVNARRSDAPWAGMFRIYLIAGLVVIILRVGLRVVFGGPYGTHVLFTLPEIPLPDWAVGVSIGGPVTLETLLAAFYDGLRLATTIACVGAANVLADARRLLRSVPNALHEVGAALVVALTVAPQLVESLLRVRRARRLRGGRSTGLRSIPGLMLPVLADALDRSLALAAAMDARGYGRLTALPARARHVTGALVLIGLGGVAVGLYGLLDATSPGWLGLPMLAIGIGAGAAGLWLGGRRVQRSVYRPDPWQRDETVVAGAGIAAAAAMWLAGTLSPSAVNPSVMPPVWPVLVPLATAGILIALLPAWLAPPVRLPATAATTHPAGQTRTGEA
jgi:energy-coupling factor transport system permease protein